MATTTIKTYTHVLHFSDNGEMSYCFSHLDNFVQVASSSLEEFNGDAPNEVVFTTNKPVSKAAIKRITSHFEPKDSAFNK